MSTFINIIVKLLKDKAKKKFLKAASEKQPIGKGDQNYH